MSFTSITDEELVNMGVTGLDDTPELSTEEMQAQFDEYPRFLKDKFRTHITEEEANTAAGNIGATIPEELTNVTDEKVQPILNELASRAGSQASTITSHLENTSNPHSVTKAQVGLGNCDNTSDLNKPISTAAQTALNGKAPKNHASSSDVYGKSTSSNFGHSKLTDTYKSEDPSDIKSANDGIGASQKGLNDAYKDLLNKIESAGHGDMLKENYDPNGDYIIDIAQGGTNANTAAQARTNLGLGSVATENTVPVSKGGSGLTSSPSMLTNLGSTSADTIMKASPRPGVTGTLPIANGGTGLTSQPSMLTNLGSTSADTIMKASPRPGVTGTLSVSNGGTGLTSQPSMLTNLDSTSADTIMKASPRPGVTGKLPVTNGGTGADNAAAARTNLGAASATDLASLTDDLGDFENKILGEVSDNAPYLLRKGKGNLADIVLEGYSLPVNQLVQNGDFADTSNWSKEPNVTLSVSNNEATITNTTAGNGIYQALNAISGHKYLYVVNVKKAVAGTVRFNILGNASNKSVDTSYTQFSGVVTPSAESTRIGIYSVEANATVNAKNVWIVDITAEFGTDIADHIYSKEQATAGSGIAWIKSYGFFSKDYEPFNLGSIQSVKASGRKVVGFNQWNEQWELGDLYAGTGAEGPSSTYGRTVGYTKVLPKTKYYMNTSANKWVYGYAEDKSFLGMLLWNKTKREFDTGYVYDSSGTEVVRSIGDKCCYIRVLMFKESWNANICINISDDNTNGTYEPYTSTTVALPNEDLRGILKRDGDNLYADGDTDIGIGNTTRKFKRYNMGSLEWQKYGSTSGFYVQIPDSKSGICELVCSKYFYDKTSFSWADIDSYPDKTIYRNETNNYVYVKDTAYNDAATFKTAMDGVYFDIELATPIIESSIPWQNPQRAYLDGTEEFIDDRDVPLPIGNTSVYQLNETLPPIEDYVDSNVAMLQANFQDGVDTIVDAIEAKGVTLSGSTPTDCATGVNDILVDLMEYAEEITGTLYPGIYPTIANVESAMDDVFNYGKSEGHSDTKTIGIGLYMADIGGIRYAILCYNGVEIARDSHIYQYSTSVNNHNIKAGYDIGISGT